MNYLHGFASGLAFLHSPGADLILVLGTVLGVFVGAVPGLGGIVLLVVLLPFLYNRSPIIGLALLLASHSAIYYAGSTTAILINTPGAPESAATCLDGYPMASRGEAGRALGISAAATTFGGWFGALVMIGAIPLMLRLVNVFHPPELFLLSLLAIIVIGQLQAGSITKGLISGGLGFLISFVGAAQSTGSLRYTFGNLGLYNGLNIAAVAIGLFAVSQMFLLFAANARISRAGGVNLSKDTRHQVWVGIGDVIARPWLTLRSAMVGVLAGVVPGIGSTAANFLSYGQAMQSSRHPERFGTGIPEGIIAPEASSISKEAGALIPTVALGIPNGPAMAVLLAALSILGLQAGPSLLQQHLPLVFWMVIVIAISSLLASAIGLGLAPQLGMVTRIPGRTLVPFVICLALLGSFESTGLFAQVYVMVIFGGLGVVFRRYGYSLPAVIVGAVLGSTAENNLILTSSIFGWRFLERPLSIALIVVIVGVVAMSSFYRSRQRKSARQQLLAAEAAEAAEAVEGADAAAHEVLAARQVLAAVTSPPRSIGELVVDLVLVGGGAAYVAIGASYPSPANLGPVVIGSAVLVLASIQLVCGFFPSLRRFTVGTPERAVMSAAVARTQATLEEAHEPAPALAGVPAAGFETGALAASLDRDAGSGQPLAVGVAADGASIALVEAPATGSGAGSPRPPDGSSAGGPSGPSGWRGTFREGSASLQALAIVGALVLTALIGELGYEIVIPAFILFYLPTIRRWRPSRALLAAAVMFGVCYGMITVLHITIPPGFSI